MGGRVSILKRGQRSPAAEEGSTSSDSLQAATPLFSKRSDQQGGSGHLGQAARKRRKTFASFFRSADHTESVFEPRVSFLQALASPTTTLDKYVRVIIDEVCRLLHADKCSIFFVNEARKEVWCVGSLDMKPFNMPWDKGIVGEVAITGQVVNLGDAHEHAAFDSTVEKRTGYIVKAMLSVPIKHIVDAQRTIGVIQVLNKQGPTDYFTDNDVAEILKVAVLIGDSFHRQHWKALRRSLLEDTEALSLISHAMMLNSSDDLADKPATQLAMPIELALQSPKAAGSTSGVVDWCLLGSISTATFNALEHEEEKLLGCVPVMLMQSKSSHSVNLKAEKLQAWADAVRCMYRAVPFHNWYHAFSVFQFTFFQLHTTSVTHHLQNIDVIALLVASLCHDLDHPGFTNSYLIDSHSDLALTYNDISVLENYHASLACKLLRAPQTAIAENMDTPSQKALRHVMIAAILATDMARHSELCQKVLTPDLTQFSAESASDRQLLVNTCLHSSDLSAQLLPWTAASAWEERICQEFRNQASLEEAAGRTPAAFMRFSQDDIKQRGKLQLDFIDFVLIPLWDPYTQLMPELRQCYEQLCKNRAKYDCRRKHGVDELIDTIVADI